MKKRNFTAYSWLQGEGTSLNLPDSATHIELPKKTRERFPQFSPREGDEKIQDFLKEQLDTEYLRDSLPSKNTYVLNQTLMTLSEDVMSRLSGTNQFPERMLKSFYQEFLSYCERKALNLVIDDHVQFWNAFQNETCEGHQDVKLFFVEFSSKTAIFYLSKLRLIKVLSSRDNEREESLDVLSPHNLFMKYFKKNSSQELEGSFLIANHYSWYTPSCEFAKKINEYFDIAHSLNYTDFHYVLSPRVNALKSMSYDIAHKNFGLLVNSILHNYFIWEDRESGKLSDDSLELLSCRFMGNKVTELSLSHWLAQYNNSYFKWNILLSPRFHNESSGHETFFKLMNEIEYYTFLAKISIFYDQTPFSFISHCSKEFTYNRKEAYWEQKDLFSNNRNKLSSKFDKLVLFLDEKPKSNPHHYVIQKCQEAAAHLKDNGHILMFSFQNIFVHSHRKRVQSFLKKFRVESIFNFQDLKGMGGIPGYCYIISKRDLNSTSDSEREECFHFRFSGELSHFNEVSKITEQLNDYFNESEVKIPTFYRKEISKNLVFEFFQDVILDGKLIQSATSEREQVTHPQFFKNMIQNCLPLNHFFEIQTLDIHKFTRGESDYSSQLDFSNDLEFKSAYNRNAKDLVLILNFNSLENVLLEICTMDVLETKSYTYGLTSCYYYYLVPRFLHVNTNLFREYFLSSLGRQVTQMSFSGSYHQAKSKIAGLLVPNFLNENEEMPKHLKNRLGYLLNSEEHIYNSHLEQLKIEHKSNERSIEQIFDEGFRYSSLSYLSFFKSSLYNCLSRHDREKLHVKKFDFNGPEIKQLLLRLEKKPIYPNNTDVFIELHCEDLKELSTPFDNVVGKFEKDKVFIELFSSEQKIASIHTGLYTGAFLNFILPMLKNQDVLQVLKNLEIPSNKDIEILVEQYLGKFRILDQIFDDVSKLVERLILKSINSL